MSRILDRKYQSFSDAKDLVMGGGGEFVETSMGTAYQINWVNQNSHLFSKVGLRKGDKIISVNGQPVGKSAAAGNALSVRQELQADCFAGLWGHAANVDRKLLDPDDLEEALTAATAIGDDRLQRDAGQQVVPDSFTHGTSAQRVKWFRTGFESGDIANCDTFAANSL